MSVSLSEVAIVHLRDGVVQNDTPNVFVIDWDEIGAKEKLDYSLSIIEQLTHLCHDGRITWEEYIEIINWIIEEIRKTIY